MKRIIDFRGILENLCRQLLELSMCSVPVLNGGLILSFCSMQHLENNFAAFSYQYPPYFHTQGRGAKAVFQFYPENPAQMELITQQAMKAGFTGGVVVDYPNSTKAKK